MPINDEQDKAIKELEKAFKKCKKAKLVFVGCDDQLFAIDSIRYDEIQKDADAINIWGVAVVANDAESECIRTYNTYLDSGGA